VITDIRCERGELTFQAEVGGISERIWIRSEADLAPNADAVLSASLLPAMKSGGKLEIHAPISPRILRMQPEYQAIQRAWSRDWRSRTRLEEVSVSAPVRDEQEPERNGRVGAFFSGGVDSWSTILTHPEITDLVFIRGTDLLLGNEQHEGLVEEVDSRLREVAAELGKRITVVETNLRQLSDPLAPWEIYFGCALVTVALFAQPLFDRVLIASEIDHEVQPAVATGRMVDHLWSTDGLEIIDDGGLYNRVERIRNIADHPLVQRSLRTCWQNPGSAYNCGRCRKCLQTMITLEALGKRDRVTTFPELDLEAVAEVVIDIDLALSYWEDLLDLTRAAGRSDLEAVVESAVSRGKRTLELPDGFRRRRTPGPPPLSGPTEANGDGSIPPTEAEQLLGTILNSRSWRMTEPLRRLAARARRLGGPRP
jgi:hypothetical protein